MLYQQLDHPLVLPIYSQYEGRVSILYRIGKDRIRVEKRRGEEKKKRERKREQQRVRESEKHG